MVRETARNHSKHQLKYSRSMWSVSFRVPPEEGLYHRLLAAVAPAESRVRQRARRFIPRVACLRICGPWGQFIEPDTPMSGVSGPPGVAWSARRGRVYARLCCLRSRSSFASARSLPVVGLAWYVPWRHSLAIAADS